MGISAGIAVGSTSGISVGCIIGRADSSVGSASGVSVETGISPGTDVISKTDDDDSSGLGSGCGTWIT
jgi:hypothetical protein